MSHRQLLRAAVICFAVAVVLMFGLRAMLAGAAPAETGRTVRVNVSINATVHVYPEADAGFVGISWRCGSGRWHAVSDGGFRPQCRSKVTISSRTTWFDYEVILPGAVA